MTIRRGNYVTAPARAERTRRKRERWIAELSSAGWTVVQAGHFAVSATFGDRLGSRELVVDCERCGDEFTIWRGDQAAMVPLPAVLAAVNGHTCEGPK